MILAAILLTTMSITYDPCEIEGVSIDSIRAAGLHGDSLATHKMVCMAAAGYIDKSEDLFWRTRYLQFYPCGVGYFEYGIKPWRVAAQFISVGLTDPRVATCRDKIERILIRVCKNDSSRTYTPCNPYRHEKPRPPLIARPAPPQDTSGNEGSNTGTADE